MDTLATKVKPKYLAITEKWAWKISQFWCVISSFLGITFIGITEGIILPVMTLLMTFASCGMIKQVLAFQKINKAFITRKTYDLAIIFFWITGVFSVLCFLFKAINLYINADVTHAYFLFCAAIFPIGIAWGAAQIWEQRFEFQ